MKVLGNTASRRGSIAAGLVFLCLGFGSTIGRGQAPYLLPYTISTVAGGGTAPAVGTSCPGANGTTSKAEDTYGDGCLANSSSVVTTANIHDVGVDQIGTIYFLDTPSNTVLRRIDPRSGIVNVAAGSATASTVCASTETDAFGDGCVANDGKGNASGGYTYLQSASRGVSVAKNGDVYIADYSNSLVHKVSASTGLMTLVAGYITVTSTTNASKNKGTTGYTGDGGPALSAELRQPRGVAADAAGNVYIADSGNNVIRMVSAATGNISTIVGKYPGSNVAAAAGFSGDGGPASAALLSTPEDVEVDNNGNLFIGDFSNNRVRVVYAGGTAVANLIAATNGGAVAQVGYIYTVAGGGSMPYTAGSIVLATSIAIGSPRKLSVDSRDNIYIADNGNDVIWFVDATTGYMRILGGTFQATTGSTCIATDSVGDNCPATQATLSPASAMGIAIGPQGDVYISDSGDSRLRKIALNTAFPAIAAGSSVTQTLFVHYAVNDGPAATSPYVVSGSPDFAVSSTPACTVNSSTDKTTDCAITVTFTPTIPGADTAILTLKSAGGFTTQLSVSGTGIASSVALDPGSTTLIASSLNSPSGVAQDSAGNIYVADTGNNWVVRYTGTTASVIAGTGAQGYSGDGAAATLAKLSLPKAVAVTPDGAVYIADSGNNVIRRIDPVTGLLSTFAGNASSVCPVASDAPGDGCPATAATFSTPSGLVADSIGNLYVADTGNNLIREISTTGYVYLVAGGASQLCPTVNAIFNSAGMQTQAAYGPTDVYGDGCPPTQAIFKSPTALAIDTARNLYIADTGNNEVRKITAEVVLPNGSVTPLLSVVAGTGQPGGSGNGGTATAAQVSSPTGLAIDAAANVYIADTGNHVIRVVNATGNISTVVGTLGSSGTGTVPGSASGVLLNLPAAIVSSGIGHLWVLDSGNNRLLSLDRSSASVNFGRTNVGASSPTATIQETATGSTTSSLGYPLFTTSGNTSVFSLIAAGFSGCSSSSSTPQTLAPGAVCGLTAQFTPPAVGPISATYTESNAVGVNPAPPAINLSGTGAVLTKTTLTTAVTTPSTGNPQYSIAFVVTATLHPAVCDPTAPNCAAAGTITFMVDGAQVGLPVTVSNTSTTSSDVITASQTINGQSVGTHTIVAVYSGDTYYASSTSPTLPVVVAQGATTVVVSANPSNGTQLVNLTLSAKVTSSTSTIPTGTVSFYAGTTLLGSGNVDPTTGLATLSDVQTTDPKGNVNHFPSSFGLIAGTYSLTGVYSGDSNYATSTSAAASLVLNPDPPAFALSYCSTTNIVTGCTPVIAGTAQGSTASVLVYVNPSNTLSGTLTFSCTNLPANSDCTFSATPNSAVGATELAGSTLSFTPVSGLPTQQSFTVTLFTNINPSNIPPNGKLDFPKLFHHAETQLAGVLGWPIFLGGFASVLGFRKRLRNTRLLAILTVLALTGSALLMNGCGNSHSTSGTTAVGTYTVTLTVTGPNGLVQTMPITFIVGAGIAGQS